MRRTVNGKKVNVYHVVRPEEKPADPIPWNNMCIFDARELSDRKLKGMMCSYGTKKHCEKCESSCAYGREFLRRMQEGEAPKEKGRTRFMR